MRRIQFYPSEELWKHLEAAAAARGVSVSAVVVDFLENYFCSGGNAMNKTQLLSAVFSEVSDFVKILRADCEFDLLTASPTFSALPMFLRGRPNSVRAQIGRSFATAVRNGAFPGVKPSRDSSGKIKRSVNHATVYRFEMSDKMGGDGMADELTDAQQRELLESMYPNCNPDEIEEEVADRFFAAD